MPRRRETHTQQARRGDDNAKVAHAPCLIHVVVPELDGVCWRVVSSSLAKQVRLVIVGCSLFLFRAADSPTIPLGSLQIWAAFPDTSAEREMAVADGLIEICDLAQKLAPKSSSQANIK